MKNDMARKSGLSAADPSVISQTNAAVHAVVLLNRFYTRTMVPKDSFSARSVIPDSLPKKAVFPQSGSAARTVGIPSFQKRTGNTSSYTNV